jgi:CoA:oxalate CoA-transferase
MAGPLSALRILDLTHMLSGPYAGMILADLGAETIKVEPPQGEGTRELLASDPKNSIDGMGAYFLTLNRNKRSVAIDLKSDAGRAVFYDLVKQVDVVLDNFAVGVAQRLGIDFSELAKHNPRIITCSITGFGSDGPGASRPAFDQVVQAMGGGMSITGVDATQAVRAGIPIGDLGGGMFAVMGILAAVAERNVSGQGQHVDVSMLDCQISMLNYMATMYLLSGEDPAPIGNSHFVHVPYNTFTTADGLVVIAVIRDQFWASLVELLDCEELRKPEYAKQPGRLADKVHIESILNRLLSQQPTAHWLAAFNAARIPCAPVNRFSQALSDTQVLHRNMVVDVALPNNQRYKTTGNPIKLSRTTAETFTPPPAVGEHTHTVLCELLGYSAERIRQLNEQGAIRV